MTLQRLAGRATGTRLHRDATRVAAGEAGLWMGLVKQLGAHIRYLLLPLCPHPNQSNIDINTMRETYY